MTVSSHRREQLPLNLLLAVLFCGSAASGAACPDSFRGLRATVETDPEKAFECAGRLPLDAQRDFILRHGFHLAVDSQPALAARHLASLVDRRWFGSVGFLEALAVARLSPIAAGRQLLLSAARHSPSLGIREHAAYASLPYALDVFREAVRAAPDEAVGLAARIPSILAELRRSGPEFATLAEFATAPDIDPIRRERAATFYREIAAGRMSPEQALRVSSDDAFFRAAVQLRLQTADATWLDHILARQAAMLFRWFEDRDPALARMSPSELYLMLAFGRAEEDDRLFTAVFDRLLQPKLHGAALPHIQARRFLAAAAEHNRLDAFLRATGTALLDEAIRDVDTLEEALEAGAIIDAASAATRAHIRTVLEPEARAERPLIALLAAKLDAGPFAGSIRPDRNARYTIQGASLQRHYFPPDDDGVESFESFERQYQGDPAWTWEDRGTYVHVSGGKVEIFANKPLADGQPEISRALAARGLSADVFVQRGHSYHVERGFAYLTDAARLVFLGTCRGLGVTAEVISAAPDAQVIATRGVGTAGVNDPLLKAINDELRRNGSVEWSALWKRMESRFGRVAVFEDYIPPDRNGAAQLAAAWYAWLENPIMPPVAATDAAPDTRAPR